MPNIYDHFVIHNEHCEQFYPSRHSCKITKRFNNSMTSQVWVNKRKKNLFAHICVLSGALIKDFRPEMPEPF